MENKCSILIVDDEKANILYLNHLLSAEYTIYTARTAHEALKRANEYSPDLILLDIVMPDINGYEILAELKESENTKDIPVIFITGLSDSGDEMKGLNLGAEDYIAKPFSDAIVKLRVRNQIKIVNQMRILDKRLEQQTIMTSIAQCFLTGEHVDVLFNKTLHMIGEFMEISQVLLFKLDDDGAMLVCKNEWIDPKLNLGTRIGSALDLKGPMRSFIDDLSAHGEMCLHSNDPVIKATMAPYRINFQNYITAPIFIKGEMRAVLDFSRADEARDWSDSEISLAGLVASIFSGVFERESIEHDLNTVLKLKSELTVEKKRAEQSSRAKSEFLSRMSHEMRTPMTAIMGMSVLAQNVSDPVKIKEYLSEVDNAAKTLLNLIDDVLNISDIVEENLSFAPSEFHFAAMLKTIFDETRLLSVEKNQSFTTDIDPSIPEILICDEKRLAQVLTYLLSNAVKFTGDCGSIQFKAFVLSTENDVLTIQIEIADNGIGISEEQQKTLFDAFEQVDGGVDRKYGGAGLGLYLSKSIVEIMGGEIWVDSELDKGAKFAFTFKAQVKSPDATYAAPVSFYGKTALLVDDVAINREIVMAMLEDTRLNFVCAADGREAVELFSSAPKKFDVILMDINMPEMDGVEATRRIRALGPPDGTSVPIIAMTANILPDEVRNYLNSGMNDHVGKPIDFDKLLNSMRLNMR